MDRLPVAMIEGRVITNVRRVPAKVVYYFTDGTWCNIETPLPDEVEQKLSAIELALSEHMEHTTPPAHTGTVIPSVPLNELSARWYANPAAILMQSNSVTQAISQPFELILELANHTLDTFNDIELQATAGVDMIFLDATRSTTLPAPNGISGVQSASKITSRGYKLQPGESGLFKFLAQQSVGAPIVGATPFSAKLIDLSYVKNNTANRIQFNGLPLNASFNLIP